MARRMLIDTAHPEETRVVVVNGNRIEEFDFEAAAKRPLRGNIYLAKVTRVEPSLQAAFVDYGGNRHGFLAFSEIHPDYYQIPVADRQVLVAAQTREAVAAAQEDDRLAGDDDTSSDETALDEAASPEEAEVVETLDEGAEADEVRASGSDTDGESDGDAEASDTRDDDEDEPAEAASEDDGAAASNESGRNKAAASEQTTTAGEADDLDDALEEARGRRSFGYGRPYKIQEVIKRRQILLVQVVKEERGNKGAALTTYLSLAGRYCVLMPNTARGGGISRKITNQTDRKRLKSAAAELEIPNGMGLIVRTAGANRTKAEIKRDYEYLLRVWETVRDLTLKSTAPALVYEEGKLIKRAIRDLYSKEIDAILVDGEEGYKEAKSFMRTLMPSHAKAVQHYKDRVPLFQRFQVESMLDQMFNPVVTLRSGGYLVINQTEALVSIDVNSGRSTREHSIEDTATRTNLEAAEEVARQLRLRDLAGLVVIDFIDMEESRNNRAVEKRLKESLKNDRARIQIGRISSFGLLEMSRQRLRAGVLEGSTHRCPHCEGTGIVRSVESAALRALRAMEEEGLKDRTAQMTVRLPTPVALYVLNHKRHDLMALEERYACTCMIEADSTLPAAGLVLERTATREARPHGEAPLAIGRYDFEVEIDSEDEEIEDIPEEELEETGEAERGAEARSDEDGSRRRRRRKRRRGGRGREEATDEATAKPAGDDDEQPLEAAGEGEAEDGAEASAPQADGGDDDGPRRRRRRGRRGGRRNRRREDGVSATDQMDAGSSAEDGDESEAFDEDEAFGGEPVAEVEEVAAAAEETEEIAPEEPAPVEPEFLPEPEKPVRPPVFAPYEPEPAPAMVSVAPAEDTVEPAPSESEAPAEPDDGDAAGPAAPARKGWWQRRFGS